MLLFTARIIAHTHPPRVAVFPVLIIKGTAPYWFHLVSYNTRIVLSAVLMVACLQTVALSDDTIVQLTGVGIGALQSGLGEATVLAMASRYDPELALTAWASGTGMAGVIGYAWTVSITEGLGWPFSTALLMANVIPAGYLATWYVARSSASRLGPTIIWRAHIMHPAAA